jgi:AcrR family transcriptional regulator
MPADDTKGARTKARVLAAAVEHFAALGLNSGSVPEIARTAGTSHATVYQHFGRKEELFREAVEADLTALFASIMPALGSTLDPETLVGLLPTLLLEGRRRPLARRVIADTDKEQTEALLDLPALGALEDRLTVAIAAAQAAGTLRADIEAAAMAAGLIAITLPMLVVAFRLDGMPAIPRAASALDLLATALRPVTTTAKRQPS